MFDDGLNSSPTPVATMVGVTAVMVLYLVLGWGWFVQWPWRGSKWRTSHSFLHYVPPHVEEHSNENLTVIGWKFLLKMVLRSCVVTIHCFNHTVILVAKKLKGQWLYTQSTYDITNLREYWPRPSLQWQTHQQSREHPPSVPTTHWWQTWRWQGLTVI